MPPKIKLNLLVFELTDACNQQCKFCYNHWKGLEESPQTIISEYSKVNKVLKKVLSQAEVSSISLSGGEPMLFSRIHDLILTARFHKSQVSVLTNGTLLTDFDLQTFQQLGVHRLQIPILSSDPSTHDKLTQLPGSWEKCVAAAKKILNTSPEKFNAVLVLNKANLTGLEKTLEFYKELGVKTVLVNRFNIGGLGRMFKEELELTRSELNEAYIIINTFASENTIRFHSGVCTPICVLNPSDFPHISFTFCNTDVSVRPITINHQGDVRFCNHSPRVLGNIFEKPLHDILYSDGFSAYFNTVPEFCASCQLLDTCKGGCRAASEQVYQTFSRVDPVVENK
ncbi:MAG TPA: radical SAM protein [Paludibacter sp.]|nr:radical SAM protein [Paludibacter sp.]